MNFSFAPTTTAPSFGGTPSFGSAPSFGSTAAPSFGSTATPSFGSSTSTTPSFGTPAPSFGTPAPSFGTNTPNFGSVPSLSTPLFGGSNAASAPSFGSTTFGAPASTNTAPSLFSSSTPSPFATSTPSFGSTAPSFSTPSLTTPSLFQPSSNIFTTPIANVSSNPSTIGPVTIQNVVASTKYGDLPADLQGHLEKLSKMIVDQKVSSEEIARRSADNVGQIKDNAATLIERVSGITNLIGADEKAVLNFKNEVGVAVRTVESAYLFNDSQRLKSPHSFPQLVELPPKYFWELVESFDLQLRKYSSTISDVESYLSSCSERRAYDPRSLGESIRAQYDIFVAVAERLATVHDMVDDRKEEFRNLRRKQGDHSNPFEPKKKSVLAPYPVQVAPAPATAAPAASTNSFLSTPARSPFSTAPNLFTPTTTPSTSFPSSFPSLSTPSISSPISFNSPAATPASTLSFGATTAPSSFSFPSSTTSAPSLTITTPGSTTSPFSAPSLTISTTPAFGSTTAPASTASPFGSASSIGSTSSFGSTASSSSFGSTASPFGSTGSASTFGSTASPFGSTAAASTASTGTPKKNTLSTSQSRNPNRKKSGNRSTSV